MSDVYQKAKNKILDQSLDVQGDSSIVLILVDDGYSFDETEDNLETGGSGDVADHELDADGYTQGYGSGGRQTPTGRAWRREDGESRVEFDFDDTTWSSLGGGTSDNNDVIGGVVIALEGPTDDTDSIPIAFDNMQDSRPTNGSDFTYSTNADGMFYIQ